MAEDLAEKVRILERQVAELERAKAVRVEFIDVLEVSPGQDKIEGRYRKEAEHVVLLFNASNGSFSVELPDAATSRNVIFIGKRADETGNTILLQTKPGQFIHGPGPKTSTFLITSAAPINLVSDRVDTWIVAG